MSESQTANEAVEKLSNLVADDMGVTMGLDAEGKSAFLPIIIGLLPVLADLLANNCAPENAEGLRKQFNNTGWGSRIFRYRYKRAVRTAVADDKEYTDWGKNLEESIEKIVKNEENDATVTAALIARPGPPPMWGIFGAAIAIVLALFLSGETLAQDFQVNQFGQTVDWQGDVVVPGSIVTSTSAIANNSEYCAQCANCPGCNQGAAQAQRVVIRSTPNVYRTRVLGYNPYAVAAPTIRYVSPSIYRAPMNYRYRAVQRPYATPIRSFMSGSCANGMCQ